jgi:hypothetical protein
MMMRRSSGARKSAQAQGLYASKQTPEASPEIRERHDGSTKLAAFQPYAINSSAPKYRTVSPVNPGQSNRRLKNYVTATSHTLPWLRTSLWKAQAVQEVLKARVSAKGIQLGVGGDPGRAVRALVEGFSQP